MATNTSDIQPSPYFQEEMLLIQRQIYFYVILSFETALGLSGNFLFLLSFIKAKNCASNMYVIMRGLAVVDIGSCLSYALMPIQELLVKDYPVQYELCRYQMFLSNVWFLNNMLHIHLLGIDRYIAITRPHRYNKCCGQLWVRHMICGQTCDELYHFTFCSIVLGYL